MSAGEFIDTVVRLCREYPDEMRVRVRVNSGEWRLLSGVEFLDVWDQPFAGTIDIDCAYDRMGAAP